MKTLNVSRSIFFTVLLCLVTLTANAQQKGDMGAGAYLAIGAGDSFSNFGLGAKFQYNVTEPIRLEGAFTYFFKKDYISMWDFSANVHYLFPINDKFTVYPIAGLGVLGVKMDLGDFFGVGDSASDSEFAFNLGAGAEYLITDTWSANFEIKYKIAADWNRAIFSFGATYKF